MPMKVLYYIIAILPKVLETADKKHTMPCLEILNTFSKLISLAYCWRIIDTDRTSDYVYVHRRQDIYQNSICKLVRDYVEAVKRVVVKHH